MSENVNTEKSGITVGVRYAIAAAVLFGSTTPIAKLFISDVHPVLSAAILYMGSGVGLSIVRYLSTSSHTEAGIQRESYPWIAGAIFFGGILAPILLMAGLKSTTASSASLLLNLEGVFTAVIAWTVFKENFDTRIALGMVCIVLGGIILSCQNDFHAEISTGSVLIILACACWGIDNNLTQKVSSSDPYQVASIKGLTAGCFNFSMSILLGVFECSAPKAVMGLFLGFLGYGLSLAFFVMALRHIGTARTGAYFSLAPFWGAVLAILLLREEVSSSLMLAGIFMGAGLWLHITERHEHEHEHEEISHNHSHVHDAHHQHGHDERVDACNEHTHEHKHVKILHAHRHCPDIHHRHCH